MRKVLSIIALAFWAGLSGCGGGDSEQIVARVGKNTLSLQEIQRQLPGAARREWSGQQAEALVRRWIELELVYQEALREGMDKSPQVQDLIKQQIKENVVAHYLDQKIFLNTMISDAEIEAYYNDHSEEFLNAEDAYQMRVILVSDLQEANAVREMISAGTPFAEVAKRRSKDGSRAAGGDWGAVPLSRLSPLLARSVPALRVGEVSRPIKTEAGYNLVLVEAYWRKGSTIPLERVKETIVERVQANKREARYQQLIEDLSKESTPQTDLNILQSLNEKEPQ